MFMLLPSTIKITYYSWKQRQANSNSTFLFSFNAKRKEVEWNWIGPYAICWKQKQQLFHFSNSINFNRAARANEIVLLLNGLPRAVGCPWSPVHSFRQSKGSVHWLISLNSFIPSINSLLLCLHSFSLFLWLVWFEWVGWLVFFSLRSIGGWPRP